MVTRKIARILAVVLVPSFLACASARPDAMTFDLKAKNSLVGANTSRFIVTNDELKIRVWSPVNRTVGYVIQRVDFIGPGGPTKSFNVRGAVQPVSTAYASVKLAAGEADQLRELLSTRGTEVRVKMRIETFTFVVD